MIASLKDENGHITIPGFYDKVIELSPELRKEFDKVPFNLENYKKSIGISDIRGEAGYSTLERVSIRPTLDVNGIWGGYTGEGAKTVIPSKAYAKLSMRLVPNQVSSEITALFQDYFNNIAPQGISVAVKPHHGGEPVITPVDSSAFQAASKAYEDTFGKKPVAQFSGGSIPIVEMFKSVLGINSVLMGFGLDTDAIHSPNESYGVFNYFKGIETIPLFYQYFAQMK
jgi:acetylornithine deacetylase/succinyl-diaminopimelate desuccinylase-like protein